MDDPDRDGTPARPADFSVIPPITNKQLIAKGGKLKAHRYLTEEVGPGDWRKMKVFCKVFIGSTGETFMAEVHWYEAPGYGQVMMKIKEQ